MNEQINILQVSRYYSPHTGGIETVVKAIAEGLPERYRTISLSCSESVKSTLEYKNRIAVYRSGSFRSIFGLPLSPKFITDFISLSKSSDIVHLHMPFPLGDIALRLSGYQGKVVLWWHSDVVRQKHMMLFYKPWLRYVLERADRIIVCTPGNIDSSDYLKYYRSKCTVIPFGLDETFINEGKEAARLYKPGSTVKFLFVGRLVYYKGCEVLLSAFSNITQAELTIIGTGSHETRLKKQAENLKLKERVHFLGQVEADELKKQLSQCDVLVLPSTKKSESYGIVQLEAMAYGKPVINTNLPGGVPCVSLDGQTGLTVEPGSVKQLESALRYMIFHPDERLLMSKRALLRIETNFQLKNTLERLQSCYEELLNEKTKSKNPY